MKNSMMVFTFSVLDRKQTILGKFVQKMKIVSWSWNFLSTVIHKVFETNSSFHVK